MFKKESLETLRQRIDLVEVLSSHIELHRSGNSYKSLCPFHDEKTPSFLIQKGDTHYHCFGCGAHGDAIAFLMSYLRMSFAEAVEHLADKFQVYLEKESDGEEKKGPSKTLLKSAIEKAVSFYHFALLYSEEGQAALQYLYDRGIDLDFIRQFQIGLAPKKGDVLLQLLHAEGFEDIVLEETGLKVAKKKKDFFSDRITFPIRDAQGSAIGFSARKFKEDTFGGKYINTPETFLFKKSNILFALSYCRARIAKEKKAIVVEGQIDALRLIYAGLNYTVAGQGTAFGEGHVKELLNLGVNHVYLALDADNAGQEATSKIGNLFQKKGVEVTCISLPEGSDPDSFIREQGPARFAELLESGIDYLTFLFRHFSKDDFPLSPSKKNEIVQTIVAMMRDWEHPVMIHESMKKLAQIADIPEGIVGLDGSNIPALLLKKSIGNPLGNIDADLILETDLLRWLFLMGETQPRVVEIAHLNLCDEHFRVKECRTLFRLYLDAYLQKGPRDLFSLGMLATSPEEQSLFSEIMQKKVNLQKAEEGLLETIRKILIRHWMEKREEIKTKIHSGNLSDEDAMVLVKEFDEIKKKQPEVKLP